jgi:Domain of unknown function (DUF4440)
MNPKLILFLTIAIALCAPTLPSRAQKPDFYTQHYSRSERDLLKVHQQRRFAMIRRDIPALSRFLDEQLVYVHSSGKTDTKKSFLESLATGALRYEGIEDRLTGIFSGPSTSVLCGTVQMRVKTPARALSFEAHYTAVYLRDKKNGWQLLRWQTTRFPEPEPPK